MGKPSILIKTPAVIVKKIAAEVDGEATLEESVAISGTQTILLDAEASEMLVDFLRVIQAYFSFGKPKGLVNIIHQKAFIQLLEILEDSGRTIAGQEEVTQLIQQLGCLHDWAQWDDWIESQPKVSS